MSLEVESSSTDFEVVRDVLLRMVESGKGEAAVSAAIDLMEQMQCAVRELTLRVAELLKKVYGRSSERISPHQLRLVLEGMRQEQQAQAPVPEPNEKLPDEVPAAKRRAGSQRRGRRPLPQDLPREEIRLLPTPEQTDGKGKMTKVGEERSEVLEYEPAKFKVLVYVRETWSNATGDIVTAAAASKVIERGIPGPGLLTQVLLSKYVDHNPLNRQTKIYARSGVELHRNRLVDWVSEAAFLLEPLARRIHESAMASHVLQVDDTHIKVLDRHKAKNIKRGHLWVMVGDQEWVSFKYTDDWTSERAQEFLGTRIGWMQVDGYGGYEPIARDRPVLLVGCWMHARRYFVKAFEAKDMRAAEPLDIIGRMYKVEKASTLAEEGPAERHERRQRDLVPLLDELLAWKNRKKEHSTAFVPKEPIGRAMTYLDNHWDILRVVEKDGALELDNGEVERIIRGPAMGRRNWLFAGSDEGGHRAATILTVLTTAQKQQVPLRPYVKDVLSKIAGGWPLARLDELLPNRWSEATPSSGQAGA